MYESHMEKYIDSVFCHAIAAFILSFFGIGIWPSNSKKYNTGLFYH